MKSDLLIWQFHDFPKAVTSTLKFKYAYASWMMKAGHRTESIHASMTARTLSVVLLNLPDVSDEERDAITELLLDNLECRISARETDLKRRRRFRQRNHPSPQRVRLEELRQCLINHQTPRQAEFLKRIARLIADHFTQQVAD